jgi:succinoglycan biosynthesis protein ExoM
MTLAVLIPTFRRNRSLERAVRSVFEQSRTPDYIVVADNSPEGGARELIAALGHEAPCPLVYVHAPEPGVANARNAGFAACSDADRIAQLDDDESADPDWLNALERVADETAASVVFGPVQPDAEGAGAVRTAWLRRLYARQPQLADGLIEKPWGCGNSLITRAACPLPSPPFDPAANETGGEDDRLFSSLAQNGARFAWSNAAEVTEHVDPERGSWAALARRALAFGQGPSQDAAERKSWLGVAAWMAIGAVQAVVFGLLIAPARLVSAELCATCVDRTVQGSGKLVWFDRFAPRFYGAALLKPPG